jgi:hypothetical protein
MLVMGYRGFFEECEPRKALSSLDQLSTSFLVSVVSGALHPGEKTPFKEIVGYWNGMGDNARGSLARARVTCCLCEMVCEWVSNPRGDRHNAGTSVLL